MTSRSSPSSNWPTGRERPSSTRAAAPSSCPCGRSPTCRSGVPGLAARLGYSRRQLERMLHAELGAGPLGLAQAQRAQTARVLIETTTLPLADVALAAGFGSVRRFNDVVRHVFATTPGELRAKARQEPATPGSIAVRLPFRAPLFPDNLFGHLAATAVPGVEEWRDGAYRRTLRLPHGTGIVALTPGPEHIVCRPTLTDWRDLSVAIARCRKASRPRRRPAADRRAAFRGRSARPARREGPRPPRPTHRLRAGARDARGPRPASQHRRCAHARRPPGRRSWRADCRPRRRSDAPVPTADAMAAVEPARHAPAGSDTARRHRPATSRTGDRC